jgi:outer membrane lipoprotein SlyB
LTLSVASVTVRGTSYPIEASVDSIETIHKGRGVTTGDAAKVGAGAAAGAILGRVLGGNKKGTIVGGVIGGIAGAGVAASSKDSDIVLPAGAHIIIRLTKELAVAAS